VALRYPGFHVAKHSAIHSLVWYMVQSYIHIPVCAPSCSWKRQQCVCLSTCAARKFASATCILSGCGSCCATGTLSDHPSPLVVTALLFKLHAQQEQCVNLQPRLIHAVRSAGSLRPCSPAAFVSSCAGQLQLCHHGMIQVLRSLQGLLQARHGVLSSSFFFFCGLTGGAQLYWLTTHDSAGRTQLPGA
jgi:hypothetical protein